ncbi:MAG: hypothetical protein Q8L21_00375 [Candidatus Komeilibacteria bacterium]|nr:hypothetical protein [Candidatus Komeilibacteria bacterium]
MVVKKIIMFPKIQPDTTIALFLLREFGEEQFPGVPAAEVDFWTKIPEGTSPASWEQEGILLLDMGGGKFDHHNKRSDGQKTSLSEVVATELGVRKNETLTKLLAYAHRDDVEGKGTISTDSLDRAFGLSGLLMSLNRDYPDKPQKVLDTILPLIISHYHEEHRRHHELPAEYCAKRAAGQARDMQIKQNHKTLKVILIETDNVAMAGYLRADGDILADVVVQRLKSGHVNIITRQWRKVDLRHLITVLRVDEMRRQGLDLKKIDWSAITCPGFYPGAPQWYYDTAANTIQNGGVNPQGIASTIIPWLAFAELVEIGLNPDRFKEVVGIK